jgi:hypothetical protein
MSDEDKVLIKRTEDFEDVYANNVRFESSVWDLKCMFGQLDLSNTPPEVIQMHTGATIPWTTAKIMAYFMAVNVYLHQTLNGEIKIPKQVMPERPDVDNPKLSPADKQHAIYVAWLHDQFFGSDPYIPPGMDVPEESGTK